ncbi:50S ribosomal protein L6 [Kangiella spongicola]|uniref:Large ribosomal subunit protein uL6 n=1 Tax=Kangiella spongicola TaxID=796379 RepID=A0A318D3W5_9GAMM|nr:50S ribosomal protein L6 [Kangiella spongicola]PXF63493.1 50S ribosomal protein L6 [Kangiella spongicola]
MSRVAKAAVSIPSGVEINIKDGVISVKGAKGQLEQNLHNDVEIKVEDGEVTFAPKAEVKSWAMAGTYRALVNNMVTGVSDGFEKKLKLVGVGYRAQVQGKKLNLSLGFSHPVEFEIPEGVTIEAPSQTDLVVKGANKQVVGQVAANIRAYRPPEPYKGKGVRYVDEYIVRKEAKKK